MAEQFNGRMLTLARQLRKKSQSELAANLGGKIAQGTISKIEHGRFQPDAEAVDALAAALSVKRSFFRDNSYLREPMISYSRRRQKISAPDLQMIFGVAEVYRLNLRKCFEAIEIDAQLPSVPEIDLDNYERKVEDVAAVVRQRWKLPRGPVLDITKTVEDAGIVVISFDFATSLMDGFAQHANDGLPPLVFLNSAQPKDRLRFSLAHEIGHLALHSTPRPEQEVEANQFAAAFLMPEMEIAYDFEQPTLQSFCELKAYWGTSIQALIYRAWQVGKLTDRQFRYFMTEISRRGWRKVEPGEPKHFKENPTTLRSVIGAHLNDLNYSLGELGDLFGLEDEDLRRLYPVTPPKPKLRLVSG